MKILLCGGTFNDGEGKPSGVVRKVGEELCENYPDNDITYLNGGNIKDLWAVFAPEHYDVMLWWPNISNDKVKIADTIKQQNNKVILVTSKRNNIQDDGSWEYSFSYMVNHALGLKSNLFVAFESSVFEPRDKKVITI